MTASNLIEHNPKCAVSVKDMAAMCGLSRQRFAQLVKAGVFPAPLYDVSTRRPFYPEEAQKICLEVRRRNYGINGKAVLFYARRTLSPTVQRSAKPKDDQHQEILDGLKALGLNTVTASQVAETLKATFPGGTGGTDQAEIIRALFIYLRRKNSAVSVSGK